MDGYRIPGAWFSEPMSPTAAEVSVGAEALKDGRDPVEVSSYHAEVFDMSSPEDRRRYESTMMDLLRKVWASQCVVWKNELQVLQGPSGSGWHRYLEWSEYKVREDAAAKAEAGEMAARDAAKAGAE